MNTTKHNLEHAKNYALFSLLSHKCELNEKQIQAGADLLSESLGMDIPTFIIVHITKLDINLKFQLEELLDNSENYQISTQEMLLYAAIKLFFGGLILSKEELASITTEDTPIRKHLIAIIGSLTDANNGLYKINETGCIARL